MPVSTDPSDYLSADGSFDKERWLAAIDKADPYGSRTVVPRPVPAWLDAGLNLSTNPYRFRRNFTQTAAEAKLHDEVVRGVAYWVATATDPGVGSLFTSGTLPALRDLADFTVKEINIAIGLRNQPIQNKGNRWKQVATLDGYKAAILALAYFSWPETGRLVMQAAATSSSGEVSADDAKKGTLYHFNSSRRWWDVAEVFDDRRVVGFVRWVFDQLMPGGAQSEYEKYYTTLRQYAEVVKVGTTLKADDVDPHLSIVREEGAGRGMVWNRLTNEISLLTGDICELACDMACSAVYMADDGTGHIEVVDEPTFHVRTVGNGERDITATELLESFFEPEEREAGVDGLWQLFSYHTSRSRTNRNLAYLYGPKGAGKSVILEIIREICGGNVADAALTEFGEDKVMMAVPGSVAVISDDNDPGGIIKGLGAKRLKSFASQGVVSYKPLFHGQRSFRARQRCYQAGNQPLYTVDRSGAIGGKDGGRKVDFAFDHSFYGDPNRSPDVLGKVVCDSRLHTYIVQEAARRCPLFEEFDMSNAWLRRSNEGYEDANDWVRSFLNDFIPQLDEAGVDCIPMRAIFECFKAEYKSTVSSKSAIASFKKEFKLSAARKLDEMGWTVELEESGADFKTGKLLKGFYEPERLYGVLASYTESRGIDESGRERWANQKLMQWVDYRELKGRAAEGRRGILDRTVRGIAYRKSALLRKKAGGGTPAFVHAHERAEEHARDWAWADDETKAAYVNFISTNLLVHVNKAKVGADFLKFGVDEILGTAVCSIRYYEGRSGLPFMVPTIGEWIDLGCPNGYRTMHANLANCTICGFYRKGPGSDDIVALVRGNDKPIYAAPTSSDADTDANTDDVSAVQEPMKDSEAVGAPDAGPAASDKGQSENGPSAPAEAVDSPAGEDAGGDDAGDGTEKGLEERYEAFTGLAEKAIRSHGGYVVLDGGLEGATPCFEVIGRDEWAAYGRPWRDGGMTDFEGTSLPLIE